MKNSNKPRNGEMDTGAAAAFLGLSKAYLHQLRHYDKGPKYTKRGHRVWYQKKYLKLWNIERLERKEARKTRGKKKMRREAPALRAAA